MLLSSLDELEHFKLVEIMILSIFLCSDRSFLSISVDSFQSSTLRILVVGLYPFIVIRFCNSSAEMQIDLFMEKVLVIICYHYLVTLRLSQHFLIDLKGS